jgi:hypothetical protein
LLFGYAKYFAADSNIVNIVTQKEIAMLKHEGISKKNPGATGRDSMQINVKV